jgi:hypothetical protein
MHAAIGEKASKATLILFRRQKGIGCRQLCILPVE